MHFIELADGANARDGYKLYRKIRLLRQKRRQLKKENELLRPVYTLVTSDKKLTNDLNKLLGDCRNEKSKIENRQYIPRTDVLEDDIDG